MNSRFLIIFIVGGVILGSLLLLTPKRSLAPPPSLSSALAEPAFIEFKKIKLRQGEEKNKAPSSSSTLKIFSWNKEKSSLTEENIFAPLLSVQDSISDLNQNSINETYILQEGRLIITESSATLWQSPENWWIDNFVIADSDGDKNLNLNLSIWKQGSFGESLPFWIKTNDPKIRNHFFVFNLEKNSVTPVWQSSNLERPNCEFTFADLDGDKTSELIVIEGEYQTDFKCSGNYLAVWKWSEWGFFNEWRSAKSNFKNLQIKTIDQKNYVTTEIF